MRRTTQAVAVAMLLTLLATPAAFSQQISDALRVSRQGLDFNAHALGMGNAYSTIGYDVAALRFNPATMAVSKKFSWTVSANANAFKSTSNYYGQRGEFTTSNTSGGQTGITLPFRLDSTRTLIVGLAYTQSKDFNNGYKFQGLNLGGRFPSFVQVLTGRNDPTARALGLSYSLYDGFGNYLGDRTVLGDSLYEKGYLLGDGNLSHYSLGAALEPVHNVFFGASASYNTGHYTSDLELSAADTNDVIPSGVETVPGNAATDGFLGADYRTVRDKQYRGWDARFGVLYKFYNFIGISASFKAPTPQEVKESVFINGVSRFAGKPNIVVPQTLSTSSYHFRPPTEMTVGAMVNMWIITGTAEANYVDYAAMKVTSGAGELPNQTEINKQIKDQLAAVLNLNVGAEVRLPFTGLSGRAGAIYQPSPYQADPSRFAQKAVTIGAGFNSNDMMQFDIAYAYAWRGENRNRQTGDASSAEQTIGYHTIMFSMRVAF